MSGELTRAEAEAVALVAAYAVLAERPASVVTEPEPSWRFSGRWFHAHPYSEMRRPSL